MKKYIYFRINEMYLNYVKKNIAGLVLNHNNSVIILSDDDKNVEKIHYLNKQLELNNDLHKERFHGRADR